MRFFFHPSNFIFLICIILLSSCSSTYHINKNGVARIRELHFTHADIPPSFNHFKIAFISDIHYKSTLQEKGLHKVINQIKKIHPDILLMGGDYKEGIENIAPLFKALGNIKLHHETVGVMGNNDYEQGYEQILLEAEKNHIRLLEHEIDTIYNGKDTIYIVGIRKPFQMQNNTPPDTALKASNFVITITHTPDYAEIVQPPQSDLFLAGHTHGGQVTFFGLYAPFTGSRYGQRFRCGMRQTSNHKPILITNGIGTSRKKIRLFAPSEICLIILHSEKAQP